MGIIVLCFWGFAVDVCDLLADGGPDSLSVEMIEENVQATTFDDCSSDLWDVTDVTLLEAYAAKLIEVTISVKSDYRPNKLL